MDWDIASSVTAILGTAGMLTAMWWKVKSDNASIRQEVADHARKIMLLITDKASCGDLIKLTEVVEKLDRRVDLSLERIESKVDTHHEDTRKHRTPDFEVRIESLIKTVEEFAKENRQDHEKIIALVQK